MSRFKQIIKNISNPRVSGTETGSSGRLDHSGVVATGKQNKSLKIRSDIYEEYWKIKTQIVASQNTEKPIHSLMVIGSLPGEGATTIAINLAHAMATGNSFPTLLVDSDLRNPSVHKYMGLNNEVGLSDILSSDIDFNQAVQKKSCPDLSIITTGREILDISNLHNTRRFQELLKLAKDNFRYVIFDAVVVNKSFDGLIFGAGLDSCLLVIRADHTPVSVTEDSYQQLRQARVNVFGAIFNRRKKYIPKFIFKDHYSPQQ